MGNRRRLTLLLTVPVTLLVTMPLEMTAQCSGAVAGLGEVSGLSGYPFQAEVKDTALTQPGAVASLTEPLTQYVARDTRGRVRVDRNMGKSKVENASSGGPEEDRHIIIICDPVKRESIALDSLKKTATVQTLYFAMAPPQTPWTPPAPAFCSRLWVNAHFVGMQIKELGHRTIEGVDAQGALERRAVPADASGGVTSPKEIISEAETWCSEELGAMILRITSTEDAGKTRRVALVNIRRENPDEVLFQIPANYKIAEAKSIFVGP
jgi:hypothetical protein